MRNAASRTVRGFSLVEVVLALGIASFALIVILGMLPIGLRQASDSEDETRAVNLMGAIVADRLTTTNTEISTIYQLPATTSLPAGISSNSFGVNEMGQPTDTDWSRARYRVSHEFRPPANGRLDPCLLTVRITWPAQDTTSPNAVETVVAIPQ